MNRNTLAALSLAAALTLSLAACGGGTTGTAETPAPESTAPVTESAAPAETETSAVPSGVEDGVLTVGMSNGAVPISNVPGSYANGYDVMIAQRICEANGWELEVVATAWDSLIPALQAGTLDAIIAGQSMTEERMEQVDMAGPYYYATFVCVTKADSPLASAQGLSDLTGTATAQSGVDFICTDMPTAMGAVATYDDLVILDFSDNPEDDFQFASEAERASHINIGMSVQKGNTVLLEAMNDVLSTMTEDDFTELMNQAVSVQPEI